MARTIPAMLLGMLCATGPATAQQPQLVEPVRKIWDKGPHNAFTDLVRFRDQWVCAFREGKGHASGSGAIRVLASPDGAKWESMALLQWEGVDLRDPHLSVTPDGRLMINSAAAEPASRDPVQNHYSFVCFSPDGKNWTLPARVLSNWQWLWRVTWHKGAAYGVAYAFDSKAQQPRNYRAALYRTADGLNYEHITAFDLLNTTEAKLVFDGDVLYCLQRRDGKPNTAHLGKSLPPYTQWEWKDLGEYFGGPNFIKAPDGSWWACGRRLDGKKATTVVSRLDLAKGTLTPALTLPSGGDTSYAGLVWHQDQLWISYYSSHEVKTSIYLARLRLK